MRGKQLLHVGRHAVVWPVVPGKDAPPRQRCEVLVQVGKKHRSDVAKLAMELFETRVPRNLRELPGNREFTGCRQSEVTLGFPGAFFLPRVRRKPGETNPCGARKPRRYRYALLK